MSEINFRGHTIKYSQRDPFWKTVESGKWESYSFDILDKYIEKGKVFLDLGSWNGVLSIYAHLLGAKVYAIEPDDTAWSELVENREANKMDFVTSQVAISDKKGWTNLLSNDFGNSESSLLTGTKRQTTPTDTLEGYVESHKINPEEICLIKADIEGSELFVIPSSKNFLEKYKPKIYLSMHPLYMSESDMEKISDTIYPIYKVLNAQASAEIKEGDFVEAMNNNDNHALLLL